MYGYNYVWMLTQASSYSNGWWRNANNCTDDQMAAVLEDHFTADIMAYDYYTTSSLPSVSNERQAQVWICYWTWKFRFGRT